MTYVSGLFFGWRRMVGILRFTERLREFYYTSDIINIIIYIDKIIFCFVLFCFIFFFFF